MKTLAFTYTKDDGSVSKRVLCLTKEPGTMFAGVDISELDSASQKEIINDMRIAEGIYTEIIANINNKFNTQKRYRNFIPAKMTDIIVL